MNEMKTINVNATTEAAVVELLANIFDNIAILDSETVRRNIELATEDGMPKSDRAIRVELANYLMNHFSLIFVGLIVNQDFRDTFMEAVSVEMALDSKDELFVANIRTEMLDGKQRTSKGNFVLNFSHYNDGIYKKLNARLSDSFTKIEDFDGTINQFIEELSDDSKLDIGYCVSNFMYLIRAFAKNQLFAKYVKSVVKSVQEQLGID